MIYYSSLFFPNTRFLRNVFYSYFTAIFEGWSQSPQFYFFFHTRCFTCVLSPPPRLYTIKSDRNTSLSVFCFTTRQLSIFYTKTFQMASSLLASWIQVTNFTDSRSFRPISQSFLKGQMRLHFSKVFSNSPPIVFQKV